MIFLLKRAVTDEMGFIILLYQVVDNSSRFPESEVGICVFDCCWEINPSRLLFDLDDVKLLTGNAAVGIYVDEGLLLDMLKFEGFDLIWNL